MPAGTSTRVSASEGMWQWLESEAISLALTTYQANKLLLIGRKPEGKLAVHIRHFDKPMGLAGDGSRLVLGTRYAMWELENRLAGGELHADCDRLYIPSRAHVTGDLDAHDIGLGARDQVYFVNTSFSCVARLRPGCSFEPVWQPPFISALKAEDRCHLNGLGMRGGKPTYATACSNTDSAAGWRTHRIGGGIVMHIPSSEVMAGGLSMPHSPRWHRNKLWLLNAGAGEFGYLSGERFVAVAPCPGFARGLAFSGDHAVIGLSRMRGTSSGELPLERRLLDSGSRGQCGLMVVNLKSGAIVHTLWLEGDIDELFDVVVLDDTCRPMALGFADDEIQRLVSFPGGGGIVRTKPGIQRHQASAPGQAAKFQQVFHLTPESLRPYAALTAPGLWERWQRQPMRGELVAVSASIGGVMTGLAIAEQFSEGEGAPASELVSLSVLPAFRQRGLEDALLEHLRRLLVTPLRLPPQPAPNQN